MTTPDDRDYPSGQGNDSRLKRWLVDRKTTPAIREDNPTPVHITGGDLYELLLEVTEWAYWNGANDTRGATW